MRLLLIEDNDRLSEFLEKALHDSGQLRSIGSANPPCRCGSGRRTFLTRVDHRSGLRDGDGLSLVKSMRARDRRSDAGLDPDGRDA